MSLCRGTQTQSCPTPITQLWVTSRRRQNLSIPSSLSDELSVTECNHSMQSIFGGNFALCPKETLNARFNPLYCNTPLQFQGLIWGGDLISCQLETCSRTWQICTWNLKRASKGILNVFCLFTNEVGTMHPTCQHHYQALSCSDGIAITIIVVSWTIPDNFPNLRYYEACCSEETSVTGCATSALVDCFYAISLLFSVH
jgi:hypothetical protein